MRIDGRWALLFLALATGCPAPQRPPPPRRTYGAAISAERDIAPRATDVTAPRWGVGVSPPLPVYEFRAPADTGALPKSCLDPLMLLDQLESEIRRDPGNCRAEKIQDSVGMFNLLIACSIRKPGGDCDDLYTATLWPEQDDRATAGAHYLIRAFAWVRRMCGAANPAVGLPDYSTIQQVFGSKSQSIEAFFARCDAKP